MYPKDTELHLQKIYVYLKSWGEHFCLFTSLLNNYRFNLTENNISPRLTPTTRKSSSTEYSSEEDTQEPVNPAPVKSVLKRPGLVERGWATVADYFWTIVSVAVFALVTAMILQL